MVINLLQVPESDPAPRAENVAQFLIETLPEGDGPGDHEVGLLVVGVDAEPFVLWRTQDREHVELDVPPSGRDNFGPFSDRAWSVLEMIREIAAEHDVTPAQVALRWVIDVDGLTSVPIAGARSPEQVHENLGVLDVSVSTAEYEQVAEAGRPKDVGWAVYVD